MTKKNRIGFFKLTYRELMVFVGAYFLSSILYRLSIWISYQGYNREDAPLFSLKAWFDSVGLHHLMMMGVAIVIWVLLFRVFSTWKLWQRLITHIFFLPLFILVAHRGYYWVCDQLGIWHFDNSGQVWDIYIPMLMYFIQFGIFHAYEYYLISQRKLKDELELRNTALKSELVALKAQLNPHFLYNIFNTINASVPPEMEETREMIADLSDLFRYQLKASIEDEVPLRDEIDFVKQYLELEKKRFEDRLELAFDIAPQLMDKKVPPMLIQPLVENSIKHGISSLLGGGKLSVKVEEKNGSLKFEISDTGVGIKDKSKVFEQGVGLSNTKLRLEKMYNAKLVLEDNLPQGLIVSFEI